MLYKQIDTREWLTKIKGLALLKAQERCLGYARIYELTCFTFTFKN
jgi:hypothetical protein